MKNQWMMLISLLLVLPLLMAACGGDDEEEGDGGDDGGDSNALTAEQVENAMAETFKGNLDPAKEITCAAEQPSDTDAAAVPELPEGVEVGADCSRDGDVMTCNMSIKFPEDMGLPEQTQEMKFNVVDEKLCGTVAAE